MLLWQTLLLFACDYFGYNWARFDTIHLFCDTKTCKVGLVIKSFSTLFSLEFGEELCVKKHSESWNRFHQRTISGFYFFKCTYKSVHIKYFFKNKIKKKPIDFGSIGSPERPSELLWSPLLREPVFFVCSIFTQESYF